MPQSDVDTGEVTATTGKGVLEQAGVLIMLRKMCAEEKQCFEQIYCVAGNFGGREFGNWMPEDFLVEINHTLHHIHSLAGKYNK